jgi:hypothetical protein
VSDTSLIAGLGLSRGYLMEGRMKGPMGLNRTPQAT